MPHYIYSIWARYRLILNTRYRLILNTRYRLILNARYRLILNARYRLILNTRYRQIFQLSTYLSGTESVWAIIWMEITCWYTTMDCLQDHLRVPQKEKLFLGHFLKISSLGGTLMDISQNLTCLTYFWEKIKRPSGLPANWRSGETYSHGIHNG